MGLHYRGGNIYIYRVEKKIETTAVERCMWHLTGFGELKGSGLFSFIFLSSVP